MGKMRFTIESGMLGNGKEYIERIKSECKWINVSYDVIITKTFLGKIYHIIIEGDDDKLLKMTRFVDTLRNIAN